VRYVRFGTATSGPQLRLVEGDAVYPLDGIDSAKIHLAICERRSRCRFTILKETA